MLPAPLLAAATSDSGGSESGVAGPSSSATPRIMWQPGALPPSQADRLRRQRPLAPGVAHASPTWFDASALLPSATLLADVACTARLLVWWGLRSDAQHWPSWCLLAFLLAPHLLVAVVVHSRLVAAACLPPAFKAAAPGLRIEHQPVGANVTIAAYSWLVQAPCWVAYPAMLVLLVPGVAWVMLCGPATLLLHLLGLVDWASTQTYLTLLQGCVAITQAPAVAMLLTFLFLWGNVPNWPAVVLDAPLYYVPVVAAMADMGAAWYRVLSAPKLAPALGL